MSRLSVSPMSVLFFGFLGLTVAGCGEPSGPPRIQVSGQVSNNGEVLKVKPMVGKVQVTFYPVVETGKPAGDPQEAVIMPNGDFTVPGTDGKGIVAGKYKIAVRQWEEFPNKDVLNGKFDDKNTPIVRDITGEEDIIIDVGKP